MFIYPFILSNLNCRFPRVSLFESLVLWDLLASYPASWLFSISPLWKEFCSAKGHCRIYFWTFGWAAGFSEGPENGWCGCRWLIWYSHFRKLKHCRLLRSCRGLYSLLWHFLLHWHSAQHLIYPWFSFP
jgi:hypothetical protein